MSSTTIAQTRADTSTILDEMKALFHIESQVHTRCQLFLFRFNFESNDVLDFASVRETDPIAIALLYDWVFLLIVFGFMATYILAQVSITEWRSKYKKDRS